MRREGDEKLKIDEYRPNRLLASYYVHATLNAPLDALHALPFLSVMHVASKFYNPKKR